MSSKTIFVPGASGYIGSAVVKLAVAQGYQVRGLSRTDESDEKIKAMGAVPVRGDLSSLDVLSRESANADVVAFLADSFNGSKFAMAFDETTKIQNAAFDAIAGPLVGTNKPVVAAGGALITKADPAGGETTETDPDDENAFVDRGARERHMLAWAARGVRVVSIRIAPWVYGNGGNMGLHFALGLFSNSGEVPIIDGGAGCISVVHVDDAARQFLLAAEKSPAGEAYNCVSDTTVTFAQLATALSTLIDVPVAHVSEEEAGAKIGPFFANFLNSPCRGSSEKAKKLLGWEPKEIGILEDITNGSYLPVAAQYKKTN